MGKKWTIAWCHNGDAGGSKRFAYEMVRQLSKRGHRIDEIVFQGSANESDYLPLESFVRSTTTIIARKPEPANSWPYLIYSSALMVSAMLKPRRIRHLLRDVADKIDTGGYDIVHVDQYPLCRTAGVLPYLRTPTVLYSHEPSSARYSSAPSRMNVHKGMYTVTCEHLHGLANHILDQYDIDVTNIAGSILTNSQYSKEVFFNRYGRHAAVCQYGVDSETFRPLALPTERLILSIGRIVKTKQHEAAVEAVAMISPRVRPRLIIATPESPDRLEDREYCDKIERLAKDTQVDLEMMFRPSQQELARLYNRATALVFVPVMEPFGMVGLEAMACGTPVIGVKEAGIREFVVDGMNGILVERDSAEIADAIRRLTEDAAMRSTLSRQGADHVLRQWTWERAADRYEGEILKLLKRKETL